MSFNDSHQLREQCITAASGVEKECAYILSSKRIETSDTGLSGCGDALVDLLHRQASKLVRLFGDILNEQARTGILSRLDDLISFSYAKFYAYPFKDLPVCWRQLYTDASILKFSLLLLFFLDSRKCVLGTEASATSERALDEMIKTLDYALILAGAAGDKRGRRWIDKTFDLLETFWKARSDLDSKTESESDSRPAKKRRRLQEDETWDSSPVFSTAEKQFTLAVKVPVKRMNVVPMEDFQGYLDYPDDPARGPSPLVISGLIDDWPARSNHPWNRPSYLLSRTFGGRRLVPVEVGRSYVDEGWGQKLVSFREFLETFIGSERSSSEDEAPPPQPQPETASPPKQISYLAQHQLFTQLPQLRADIFVPDYCYTAPPPHPTDSSQNQPDLVDGPQLNAWLGPPGTITPLHTDPYHNLLVQVVGRKYVRLYAPQEGARMRPRGREDGVEMGNTSTMDVGVVEGWDVPREAERADDGSKASELRQWVEDFREVPFVDCILEPGDTLYIPIGWWHYVRGLSVSFSVSFWWN